MVIDDCVARSCGVNTRGTNSCRSAQDQSRDSRPCHCFSDGCDRWLHYYIHRLDPMWLDCRPHPTRFHRCVYDRVCNQHCCWASSYLDGNYWFRHSSPDVRGCHQHTEAPGKDATRRCNGTYGAFLVIRYQIRLQIRCKEIPSSSEDLILRCNSPNRIRHSALHHDQLACK